MARTRRGPRLDHSIIDICLQLCDEKIAELQKQRAALVAEKEAHERRRVELADRPSRAKTPTAEPIPA
jgi:hypothetical protein